MKQQNIEWDMVSSSDRFRKHHKIVHCLPPCTSNIVWVGDDTINKALRHNCGISTTMHVTQTADQITSPNKPNHNHNAQPPTQTHLPEVRSLTQTRLLMPTVICVLLLLSLTYISVFLVKQEHYNTKWEGTKVKNKRKHVNQQKLLQNINWAF